MYIEDNTNLVGDTATASNIVQTFELKGALEPEDSSSAGLDKLPQDSSLASNNFVAPAIALILETHEDILDYEPPSPMKKVNQQSDTELKAMKARLKELEAEAEKFRKKLNQISKPSASNSTALATVPLTLVKKQEIDMRSVHVGNVDYSATEKGLESHFIGCGSINRVTIPRNKANGHPKGFAYIEFRSKEFVETAIDMMNETLFCGRKIKVLPKRTNHPGLSTTNRFVPVGSFRSQFAVKRVWRASSDTCFHGSRRSISYGKINKHYAPY